MAYALRPLFRVASDGVKAATVETFSNSDPVNSILAAFAVSVKMEVHMPR